MVIASRVASLNRQHEAIWEAMRSDPSLSPVSAREEARKLLKGFGIDGVGRSGNGSPGGLFDYLESKRIAHADRQSDPEEAYRFDPDEDFLSVADREALRMLQKGPQFLLSDALDLYLSEHPKRGGRQASPRLRRTLGEYGAS